MSLHQLKVHSDEPDEDGWIEQDLEIICTAPVGAWCRLICPEGCEEWGPEHEHRLVDYGQCLAAEWVDAAGWDSYADDGPYESGPVRVFWEDGWTFESIHESAVAASSVDEAVDLNGEA